MVIGRCLDTFRRAWDIPGPSSFIRFAALAGTGLALIATGCGKAQGNALREPSPPPVPRVLADGRAPAATPVGLRTYRGRPVLGARTLSPRSGALGVCPPDPSLRRPTPAGAWVSTEGLSVGYYARGTPPLWACDAVRIGGRLRACSRAASPSRDPDRLSRAGGSVGLCGARRVGFMWIAAPVEARWALADHESYWVAYPTPSSRLVRISGVKGVKPQGSFSSHVAFFSAAGRLVREATIQGFVAG